MSIRLNKALRELNIGLQTAVEFLSKRSDLGEVEAEPSFKLSDQQYKALTDAFSQDKKVRDQAKSFSPRKQKIRNVFQSRRKTVRRMPRCLMVNNSLNHWAR